MELIRAVLFDLDQTLHDRAASLNRYVQDQYHRLNFVDTDYELYFARFVQLDNGGYANKLQVFATLVEEFKLTVDAEFLLDDFRGCLGKHCQLFPDIISTLVTLRSSGLKLSIVTNGTVQMQQVKLRVSGLDRLVDNVLISESEGCKKPAADMFLRAAERLGVAPEACLFVGDNPVADVLGAATVGMGTVWVSHGRAWPEELDVRPDYQIDTVSEILPILVKDPPGTG